MSGFQTSPSPRDADMKTNNAIISEMRKDEVAAESAIKRRKLLDHLSRLLPCPDQRQDFAHHMVTEPPAALRLNSLMPQSGPLRSYLNSAGMTEPVPWCSDAFVLPDTAARLGHCLEFGLGALYIRQGDHTGGRCLGGVAGRTRSRPRCGSWR